jgi:hypothetical protein
VAARGARATRGKNPARRLHGQFTAALEANLVGPFRDGLRELGYQEGRNIVIEPRRPCSTAAPHRAWHPSAASFII